MVNVLTVEIRFPAKPQKAMRASIVATSSMKKSHFRLCWSRPCSVIATDQLIYWRVVISQEWRAGRELGDLRQGAQELWA